MKNKNKIPSRNESGMTRNDNKQKGVAALLTVIVISAAALIMAYASSLLGLGELDLGFSSHMGNEALSAAGGCTEEAFRRIKMDEDYGVGLGDIDIILSTSTSCTVNVQAAGQNRTITSVGSISDYNKKIEATITLSGAGNDIITVNAWEEKGD